MEPRQTPRRGKTTGEIKNSLFSSKSAKGSNTSFPLKEVVAMVDCYQGEDEGKVSMSSQIGDIIEKLGGKVCKTISANTTHLVWKDGKVKILEKAQLVSSITIVSPLWVDACKVSDTRLDEKKYPIPSSSASSNKRKHVKSMVPKSSGLRDTSDALFSSSQRNDDNSGAGKENRLKRSNLPRKRLDTDLRNVATSSPLCKVTRHSVIWRCAECTLENIGSVSKCALCNEPKPNEDESVKTDDREDDVEVDTPASVRSVKASEEPSLEKDGWTCSKCTLWNDNSKRTRCEMCNARRTDSGEKSPSIPASEVTESAVARSLVSIKNSVSVATPKVKAIEEKKGGTSVSKKATMSEKASTGKGRKKVNTSDKEEAGEVGRGVSNDGDHEMEVDGEVAASKTPVTKKVEPKDPKKANTTTTKSRKRKSLSPSETKPKETVDKRRRLSEGDKSKAGEQVYTIALTGASECVKDMARALVKNLKGGTKMVSDHMRPFSHLVMSPSAGRTLKVLFALARGSMLVQEKWLFESLGKRLSRPTCGEMKELYTEANKWLNPKDFEVEDFKKGSNGRSILAETKVFVAQENSNPSRQVLVKLVTLLGGVCVDEKSEASIEILPSCNESDKVIPCVAPDWLFDSITEGEKMGVDLYMRSDDAGGSPGF